MVSLEQMQESEASMKSQFATLKDLQQASENRVVEMLQAQALRGTTAIDIAVTAQLREQESRFDTAVSEKLQGIDAHIGVSADGVSTRFSAGRVRVSKLVAGLQVQIGSVHEGKLNEVAEAFLLS